MGRLGNIQQELRRRSVYRAATIYLVVAWGATEIVTFLLEKLLFPEWVVSLIAIAFVVGFPVAMILAWHFDITTDGVRSTAPASSKGGLAIVLALGLLLGGTTGLFFLIYPNIQSNDADTAGLDQFSPPERSIAVLPFVDLSVDGEQEYLASGIAETLLHQLAQINDLHVIARTSSFVFKDQNKGVGFIGRRLNVGAVLQGSVQKAGGDLRIAVQLIDTIDDSHIWSETFDRPDGDIFEMQDEIASTVTRALRTTLTDVDLSNSANQFTEDVAAYDLYLLGKHYWHKRTEDSLLRAVDTFNEVIKLDPQFALAYTALADVYGVLPDYSNTRIEDVTELAEAAVRKAFELEPELAEAHASTGLLRMQQGRFDEADRALETAIARAPAYAMAQMWYGRSLALQGRYREAIPTLLTARRLDPLSATISGNLGIFYFWTAEPEKARIEYRRAIATAPEASKGYLGLGLLNRTYGDFLNSVHYIEIALNFAPNNLLYLRELAWAYVGLGYDDKADSLLAHAETIDSQSLYVMYGRKLYYLDIGRPDEFLEYTRLNLERHPDSPFVIADAALARAAAGDFTEAVIMYERIGPSEEKFGAPLFDNFDFLYGYSHALTLIKGYQMTGDNGKADRLSSEVEEYFQDARDRGVSLPNIAYFQACLDALRGYNDAAIESLQQAYDQGWRGYRLARHNPALKSLHGDDRFGSILAQAELDMAGMRTRFETSATE